MFETIMHEYSFQILLLIVCAVATAIGFDCRELYKRHIDSQEKEAVAFSAAAFVEQVFHNLHGIQKMNKALETAETLLASRGIKFSAAEMMILIEAAVGQFNDAFNRDAGEDNQPNSIKADEKDPPPFFDDQGNYIDYM